MDKWEKIEIEWKKYEKIVWILKKDWELVFYLFDWKNRKKVEYKYLLNNLIKTDFWNKVLKLLNQILNLLNF